MNIFLYFISLFPGLYNGGNNDGDPPLSIPNREVKPICADGTAIPSGRVGSRQSIEGPQDSNALRTFFVFSLSEFLFFAEECQMETAIMAGICMA